MKNKDERIFFVPRDENGNKKIWNEATQQYEVNENLYAKPLLFAPIDSNGNKMIWDETARNYKSKATGQVFSTITMDFVPQRELTKEEYMENFIEDDNEIMSAGIDYEDEFDDFDDSLDDCEIITSDEENKRRLGISDIIGYENIDEYRAAFDEEEEARLRIEEEENRRAQEELDEFIFIFSNDNF